MSDFVPSQALPTRKLHLSAKAARDPNGRESRTSAFIEDFLNHHMAKDNDNIKVNSQQPSDESTKSVDLTVTYWDRNDTRVLLLFVEAKRAKQSPGEIKALENQVISRVEQYFESEIAPTRDTFYLVSAYSTNFFFWRAERSYISVQGHVRLINVDPITPKYLDATIIAEGKVIVEILRHIAASRTQLRVDTAIPKGTPNPTEESKLVPMTLERRGGKLWIKYKLDSGAVSEAECWDRGSWTIKAMTDPMKVSIENVTLGLRGLAQKP